ncbi:MAG TPA: HEAT repeat domain-containing protein, partial [Anaerolineaceae bacterium]|nr:HEAT repeat domain-containing protein [Anaerolineaceae bacterium]
LEKVFSTAQRRGLFREDVRHVLMIGGTSLIPLVQQALEEYFGAHRIRVDKPFTAVAEGALRVVQGLGVEDYLMHSYGLRTLDRKTGLHRYEEVVAMGSSIPCEEPVEVVLEASIRGQRTVEFVVGEFDSDSLGAAEVRYEGGQTAIVAQAGEQVGQVVPLNPGEKAARVCLDPPGQPGKACLQASFSVDARRQLRLTVTDRRTRQVLLHDTPLLSLEDVSASHGSSEAQQEISGMEPVLNLKKRGASGERRLSIRGFMTLLLANIISPKKVSLDALAATLHGEDFLARFNAAEVLAKRGDRDARLALEQALENGAAPVRASVARQLYHLTWFSAEPLFRRALADPDPRVPESAVYALGLQRSPAAAQMLEGFLPGAPDPVLRSVVWSLEHTPTAEAVSVLALALRARDGEIRAGAVEALGATGAPDAVGPVRGALRSDPDLEVRYSAAQSLVELMGEESFPSLCTAIRRVRGAARECLLRGFFHASNYLLLNVGASRHAEKILEMLEIALRDDLGAVRLLAGKILAWMRHPRAEEILRAAFEREADPDVQSYMLYNTWCLLSPMREELLPLALGSSQPAVRKTAEYLSQQKKELK